MNIKTYLSQSNSFLEFKQTEHVYTIMSLLAICLFCVIVYSVQKKILYREIYTSKNNKKQVIDKRKAIAAPISIIIINVIILFAFFRLYHKTDTILIDVNDANSYHHFWMTGLLSTITFFIVAMMDKRNSILYMFISMASYTLVLILLNNKNTIDVIEHQYAIVISSMIIFMSIVSALFITLYNHRYPKTVEQKYCYTGADEVYEIGKYKHY